MSESVQPSPVAIESGPPELQERNTWVAARLAVSSTVFLFLPFVFGYLYLASLNNAGLWRPNHLHAPFRWGLAIMLCVAISAVLLGWASSELAHGRELRSRWLSLVALCFGLAAVVLQGVEYARLSFGPADGGFASVFVGWSGFFALAVLGAMVWLEMIVASAFRQARHGLGTSGADLNALGFYVKFLAGLGAVTFAFLYLV